MSRNPPLIDLHEDIAVYYMMHGGGEPIGDYSKDIEGRQADIPKYRRANTRIVFAALFPGIDTFGVTGSEEWRPATVFRSAFDIMIEQIRIYYRMSKTYGINIIEEYPQVEEIVKSKEWRLGFVIHLEGADPLTDPYDLEILHKLGLRSIGITWNFNNKYASSCYSRKDYGLTDDGEELIKLANKLGVIIDLAHASTRTALEAIEASKRPVVISHANVRRIANVQRNVTEEVLEALYEKRGVIGVTMVPVFIVEKGEASLEKLVNHIMFIYETYGPDILAIGTDFHGLLDLKPPKGLEAIDKVPILLEKLKEEGMSENDIEKIAYKNAMRILKENLGE